MEEKQAYFEDAVELYNNGFVEEDYVLRSLASVRFEEAVEIVLETGTASTSFLQRKLSVGYARGAKIMDQLEEKGIIGPQDGAKKREVRINKQQWLEMQNQGPAPKMNAETAEQMRFEEAESDEDQTDAE